IYNLYGSLGVSFFYHNPKARHYPDSSNLNKRRWVALRPLMTENKKYSPFQLAIPMAVGIRYKLSLQWDMEIEMGYRFTFTDYLDDVSGRYQDPASLKNDLARKFSNRTAEKRSALNGRSRDLDFIQNGLGRQIIESDVYNYVQDFGPGTQRG